MKRNQFYNYFNIFIGLVFVGFEFFLLFWFLVNPPDQLFGYLFLLIWGFVSYIQLKAGLIRRTHLTLANSIEILKISEEFLSFKKQGTPEVINQENLKCLDLYYSWNTSPFSSDLQYAEFELKNGQIIIIPDRAIEIYRLESVFQKKTRYKKNRFMNRIKFRKY